QWQKGKLLGTGAYSTCYAARDIKSGTLMAVKQVKQQQVYESLIKEISLLNRLNHPNIVRCYGATVQDSHFNIFAEWLAGGSIASMLHNYGPFQENISNAYCLQILRGLVYLHDRRIVHRDVKGDNILVDATGRIVKLADFGSAIQLTATKLTGAGLLQGQMVGTVAFMAPEVLRGENYGRSSDVWSLGCVMIQMLTGKLPWGADNISNHFALIYKIATATETPSVPEHLRQDTRDFLLRCLESNREFRPKAKELLIHPLFRDAIQPPSLK
ncbi:uncharacterized protein TRIADDRAFT_28738, partial [Trichoplax adhaerens]